MASFEGPVLRVDRIEEHANAHALEVAVVRGYRCVVRIGAHQTGDLVAYIPEDAIVPEELLRAMRLWDEAKGRGMLAGQRGEPVKAIRLRGIVSQGLLYPVERRSPGQDLAAELDIVKYEPEIPIHMQGEVCQVRRHTLSYDVESLAFGFDPELSHPQLLDGGTLISSKGLADTGFAFQWNEANDSNLYVMAFRAAMLEGGAWDRVRAECARSGEPLFILGETVGKKVQDLHYGQPGRSFRVFDIYVGRPRRGRFLDYDEMVAKAKALGLEPVPRLYRGPYSLAAAEAHRDGKTTFRGQHVREGIVIAPVRERECGDLPGNRVKLKFVSPKCLLRRRRVTDFN